MTITQTPDRLEVIADPPLRVEEDADHSAADTTPVPTDVAASNRPTFTITDAASACAVSRKTITRKLADLAEHGAAKDADGVWRIPVEALLAVGLHPGRSLAPTHRAEDSAPASGAVSAPLAGRPAYADRDMVTIPRDRWDDLRIRLARAEAEASERAHALADARLALRALTAAPSGSDRSSDAPIPGPTLASDATTAATPVVAPGIPAEPGPLPSAAPSTAIPSTAIPMGAVEALAGAGAPETAAGPLVPAPDPAEQVVTARTQAAQRGGYVPPAGAPARKRRWWQAK